MAFAASQIRVEPIGSAWLTSGKWTGAVGDTTGTVKVPGALVLGAQFSHNLASGGPVQVVPWSYTAGTNPSTVTIHNGSTVTAGQFFIISR